MPFTPRFATRRLPLAPPFLGALLLCAAVTSEAQQPAPPPPAAEPEAKTEPTALDQLRAAYRLVEVSANTKKNLKRAISLYEAHLDDPSVSQKRRVDALCDLSRAYLRLGDLMRSNADRLRHYEKGREVAQRAMRLAPKNADAVFWDAANMALVGRTRGITNSLFMLSDLKAGLRKALKLDPSHNYARDTLGRIYHAVPGMLGGSDATAKDLFNECIRRDPNFTPCKVTLSRFYVDNGETEKARVLLNAVINTKKPSVPNDYRKFNLPDAKKDLKKLGR